MQVGVMITNGGPHSADKWAATTASQLMDSVFSAEAQQTIGAKTFELELLKILSPHHDKVHKHERDKIEEHGMDRLAHPIDPREHCAEVVSAIAEAAKQIGKMDVPDGNGGTKTVDLGAHFAQPEVQEKLAGLIGSHFATSMDIERSWHADRNANDPVAQAYRKARLDHGAAHAHAHIHPGKTEKPAKPA
jgi:hypothetical protein